MTETLLTPKIGYRFVDSKKVKVDALFGFRYWHLGTNFTLQPTQIAVLYITRASSIFLIKCAFLVCLACLPARAQAPEFLPEVDAHLKLNSSFRAYLEAKDDRDGGDRPQFAICLAFSCM
jgi:hypothetical protein